ncbi:hypothetical protein [Celeribacter arenosi]|uniref:Uncharacterized protein n=1 Tax=Celeribacter arenosi TaxID=792649 RepID=A0ABP7KHG8_9RHOB
MGDQNTGQVRRRRVFYIPGYDPMPPRRYRELYRTEGEKQAKISDFTFDLTRREGARFGWSVEAEIEGQTTHTEFEILEWADIVQDSMRAGVFGTYAILLRTAWIYISTGTLFDLMKLRRGPVIAALYPVAILTIQLLLALALFGVVYAIGAGIGGAARGLAAVLGLGAAYALLVWFKRIDGKFFAYYLMHDYGFSARWRGANPPALRERMDAFRHDIAEALSQPFDEVLVVGHSSGAHLGIEILADLIRREEVGEGAAQLSFLTLGQVVPMVSFLPQAYEIRRDLRYLSQTENLFWVDVTAPGDPCSFALCDPVQTTGVAGKNQRHPLILSAAFSQTLSSESLAAMKHRFFRLHFQYLCAFDHPQSYDYFRVTAGPQTLASRFEGEVASPSRITRPVNRHRTMAQ